MVIGSTDKNAAVAGAFGSGTGQFEFTLDRVPPGRVPDAGSTITMLGTALCILFGTARRVKSLTP
jgi:VPDSG-CTERM motif